MILPRQFFVTGTDTYVGKTFACAVLALGLNTKYWKPIQSGTINGTDTDWIRRTTRLPEENFYHELYRLKEPLSPHAAAKIDGVDIDITSIKLPGTTDERLIVEGAGGVMVPINDKQFVLDIIKTLALPVVVVARSGLGTINHTVLTVNCLRSAGLEIAGIIMNGVRNPGNKAAIEYYGKVRVIAEIEPIDVISRDALLTIFNQQFAISVPGMGESQTPAANDTNVAPVAQRAESVQSEAATR